MRKLTVTNLLLLAVFIDCLLPTLTIAHRHRHRFHGRHHKRPKAHKRSLTKSQQTKTITPEVNASQSRNAHSHLDPVNLVNENEIEDSNFNSVDNQNVSTSSASSRKYLDAEVLKSLLQELLTKLEGYTHEQNETFSTFSDSPHNTTIGTRPKILPVRHCNLHGLWLSSVAGAAIELIPQQDHGHEEIHTKIYELPDNPNTPLINSQWSGKGIISPESHTTLTIIFQEHIDKGKENHFPRTVVFVGQCLVCHGNPTLQGTWVVFPQIQTCDGSGRPQFQQQGFPFQYPTQMNDGGIPDMLYLLRY